MASRDGGFLREDRLFGVRSRGNERLLRHLLLDRRVEDLDFFDGEALQDDAAIFQVRLEFALDFVRDGFVGPGDVVTMFVLLFVRLHRVDEVLGRRVLHDATHVRDGEILDVGLDVGELEAGKREGGVLDLDGNEELDADFQGIARLHRFEVDFVGGGAGIRTTALVADGARREDEGAECEIDESDKGFVNRVDDGEAVDEADLAVAIDDGVLEIARNTGTKTDELAVRDDLGVGVGEHRVGVAAEGGILEEVGSVAVLEEDRLGALPDLGDLAGGNADDVDRAVADVLRVLGDVPVELEQGRVKDVGVDARGKEHRLGVDDDLGIVRRRDAQDVEDAVGDVGRRLIDEECRGIATEERIVENEGTLVQEKRLLSNEDFGVLSLGHVDDVGRVLADERLDLRNDTFAVAGVGSGQLDIGVADGDLDVQTLAAAGADFADSVLGGDEEESGVDADAGTSGGVLDAGVGFGDVFVEVFHESIAELDWIALGEGGVDEDGSKGGVFAGDGEDAVLERSAVVDVRSLGDVDEGSVRGWDVGVHGGVIILLLLGRTVESGRTNRGHLFLMNLSFIFKNTFYSMKKLCFLCV